MIDLCLVQFPNPILKNPKMYMPLGILYLAAVAEQAGYKVEVIDLRNGNKALPQAQFYGFSCTTPEVNDAKRLAKEIRGTTIVGGGHASLMTEDCIGHFDYIVRGEGEEVILDILSGKLGKGVISASRIDDLDKIPYPAWNKLDSPFSDTLFPGEKYGIGKPAATLIASRGCPFHCAFCGNIYHAPVVYRSVDNIIGELKALIERGVYYFRFEDDNFTIHPQFEQLCEAIWRLGIHYKAHTRSDLIDIHKARLLRASGCEESGLGVESADDSVLRLNRKRETASDHEEAVIALKAAGIRVRVYWMAGLPGETQNTIKLNMDFMKRLKPDKWTLSTFTPYPGCEVFHNPQKFGITIVDNDWSNWWNFVKDHYVHVLNGQTAKQMWRRYKDFYKWLEKGGWKN